MLFLLPTIFIECRQGHLEFLASSAQKLAKVNKKFWRPLTSITKFGWLQKSFFESSIFLLNASSFLGKMDYTRKTVEKMNQNVCSNYFTYATSVYLRINAVNSGKSKIWEMISKRGLKSMTKFWFTGQISNITFCNGNLPANTIFTLEGVADLFKNGNSTFGIFPKSCGYKWAIDLYKSGENQNHPLSFDREWHRRYRVILQKGPKKLKLFTVHLFCCIIMGIILRIVSRETVLIFTIKNS